MKIQIGSIIKINQIHYRVGRKGDVRKGDRIVVGYRTFINRWGKTEFHTHVFSPTDMKDAGWRREYQPAFGTIEAIRKCGRSAMVATVTGIPCEVFISYQGRCLHETETPVDEMVGA